MGGYVCICTCYSYTGTLLLLLYSPLSLLASTLLTPTRQHRGPIVVHCRVPAMFWQMLGARGGDAVDNVDDNDEKNEKERNAPPEKKGKWKEIRWEGKSVNAAKRHDMT
jgi:hypothetical protein